jgi:predicted DNA-binding protein (MmcQ/YjbR family)
MQLFIANFTYCTEFSPGLHTDKRTQCRIILAECIETAADKLYASIEKSYNGVPTVTVENLEIHKCIE